MIRYAVDRSRQTRGGMVTSVAVHAALLLLLGLAMRQGAPLPIAAEKLTKVTYIEAHQGENVAQKIRAKTMATRHPRLAEGKGISTRSARKPKPLGNPGKLPKIERPTHENLSEIAAPTPQAQRVDPRELAKSPRLETNSRQLAKLDTPQPTSRREASVEDASSATPRLKARSAPQSFDGGASALQNKRSPLDLAGGDIDPAPRTSTGSQSGLAETGTEGVGRATLKPAGDGSTYRAPVAGLNSSRRGSGGIADVGSDEIATTGNGGSDDASGRRTILDYGSGRGGGLRGRVGGQALATETSRVDPTQAADDPATAIADAGEVDLSQQGMGMSISGQISGRKILQVVPPEYSRSAKQKGWEGVVGVHFTVLPDGRVKDNVYLEQTSAHRDLNQSALRAIRKFRFAALPASDPQVEQWGVITFVFRLK
jgi:TonB family protein